jgi:diaminopimelate epimerase
MLRVTKAHAFGNDFLYVEEGLTAGRDVPSLARALCDRHAGIGADGLIVYRPLPGGAAMRLTNADGSPSEVSGNGVRCLGAVLLESAPGPMPDGTTLTIHTDAGPKRLELLGREERRYTFRAAMGQPTELRQVTLDVAGESLAVVTLRVGNPQCVRLESGLSEERMRRLGAALEHHPAFPEGTNVEFATVEAPDRVRILIWERGVGPTMASGTGACAAAVAAAAFGGAARDVQVTAPGGTQRVEWRDDGLMLTGWATVVFRGEWAG